MPHLAYEHRDKDKITVSGITNKGMVRPGNEDCFDIKTGDDCPEGIDSILIVADGMGGHEAGEIASRTAVKLMGQKLSDPTVYSVKDYSQVLRDSVVEVNTKVCEKARAPEYHGMGTTLVTALISEDKVWVANVGDSRCYVASQSDSEIELLTRDHSWVMDQVEEGLLTQDQARTHRMSNVITKAIGLDPQMEIADRDVSERSLGNGDMVLLCTDGLHPQFENDDDIKKILLDNSPEDACEKLVVEANAKGGPDNITVIVANISPDSPKAAAKEVGKPDTEIITGFVNLIKKALNKLIR